MTVDNHNEQPVIVPVGEGGDDVAQRVAKLTTQVDNFIASGEFDIAQIALEQALPLIDSTGMNDVEKANWLVKAVEIYARTYQFEKALEYCNRMILLLPSALAFYRNKAGVLENWINNFDEVNITAGIANKTNSQFRFNYLQDNLRRTCQVWLEMAKAQGDTANTVLALNCLAASYLRGTTVDDIDLDQAERYATEALSLDPTSEHAKHWLNVANSWRANHPRSNAQ